MSEDQKNKEFTRRLKVVVPYRDREQHFREFLPHVQEFLEDAGIPYHVVVAEQAEGLSFNRGAMKNIGFLLGGPSDYTCFHDVDYLPLSADYSWSDNPACLVMTGANRISTRIEGPARPIQLDMANFFGGVVVVPDMLFRQVDGYSNEYWGWGYEDTDLAARFNAAGISVTRRPGTFCPLPHDSHGYDADGYLNADASFNRALFLRKWKSGRTAKADGISTLAYEILSRETLCATNREISCERIKVRLFPAPR
jgi:N-terminal domain of galactosyltransferase/N-terminal region of glycosyl transferase group 7